jgi:hypothetical protein
MQTRISPFTVIIVFVAILPSLTVKPAPSRTLRPAKALPGEGTSLCSRDGARPVSTAALQIRYPYRKAGVETRCIASLPRRRLQPSPNRAFALPLHGAVSRLRRVKSKAPALQRGRFCKAGALLLLRRRLEPSPSHSVQCLCIPSGMPRPVEKHATTHLCIPPRGCIPDGIHDNYTRAATGRYNPDGLPDVHVFQPCLRPSALKLTAWAPALQRSGFCKAAVETGRAPSPLLRRRPKPSPSQDAIHRISTYPAGYIMPAENPQTITYHKPPKPFIR